MKTQAIGVALFLFASTSALAQEMGAESPPPPPPATPADAPVAEPGGMRVRWGVTGGAGYFIPASAVDFGASARIGVQLSNLLGAYLDVGYTAGIGLGGSFTGTGGSISVSGVGFWHVAPTVELDLGKFFIAGGPALASGGWGQISQGADSSGNATQSAVATSGLMYGLDLRTGLTFGAQQPSGRRSGFTLALDFKLLAARVVSVTQQAGSSGASQSIRTGDMVIGMTPMLVLGYDAK
jgi:hypothetical protein